jgi:hypothetical protein
VEGEWVWGEIFGGGNEIVAPTSVLICVFKKQKKRKRKSLTWQVPRQIRDYCSNPKRQREREKQ